jgi:hypothetical protein
MGKEEKRELKPDELLYEQRLADGWTTTEWGEFVPPVTEIDNKTPAPQSKSKVTQNKVTIPAVAVQKEK